MYLYPEWKDILDLESIKQFIADLKSGKLHREFHNGPESTTTAPAATTQEASEENALPSLPESTFIKLAPCEKRYTILKDEFWVGNSQRMCKLDITSLSLGSYFTYRILKW